MIFFQQFCARPWAVALSHCCSCRIGMAPTQYLNVKCGGYTVSLQHFCNISNVLCLPHNHSQLNSITYSIKYFTPLFRKQKLSCLQHCFRLSSTAVVPYNQESDVYRRGDASFLALCHRLQMLNIDCTSLKPGQHSGLMCPECQGGSTKERSLSLLIGEDGISAQWNCHRAKCGWRGATKKIPISAGSSTRELETLAMENATSNAEGAEGIPNVEVVDLKDFTVENLRLQEISAEIRDYLATRQISRKTLQRNGVMQTRRNNRTVIAFTFRRNGKIVNCKYRDVHKRFWQETHGEKIPYGLDDIKEAREIIIVEGEIDKLSMEEVGYKNCISVPDGAPSKVSTKALPPVEQDKKYGYLWSSKEYFEQATRIILATDADKPGQALAEELARRLGRERCWRVTWPRKNETENELCKDANEVLMNLGKEALKKMIEDAELYPIQGLFRFSRFFAVIDAYYNRQLGTELGVSTGWLGLDELYRVVPGELTLVTGVPNSGKSEWIDALLCNLSHGQGWSFVLCSMENKVQEHARKLLEKHIRKPFFDAKYGESKPRMTADELEQGKQWLNEMFFLIRCENEELPSIDWVLGLAKAAVFRHGVRGLVIDPYNELDHRRPANQLETEYVSQMLTKVKRFAQHHDCHVWFVAHPRQLQNWNGGAPSLYDISGSAHFINKCDNGIVVHRNRDPEAGPLDEVQILVRKVRNKMAGNIGDAYLSYNRATGEYADCLKQSNPFSVDKD